MMYRHHTILRLRAGNGFRTVCLRLAATLMLALVLPVLASGYTVVMRGGHRVNIPDTFQLTETALTYEVSPGILVALQISTIDIEATDLANGSLPGTLLRRIGQESGRQTSPVAKSPASRAIRTLTNLDLEKIRLKRLENEAAYEIRRKELGWPSREETDRRRQEESVWARGLLARSEVERAEAENYWRARATELRNEISLLNSEIEYARSRLADTAETIGFVSYGTIGRTIPFVFSRTPMQGPSAVGSSRSGSRSPSTQGTGTVGNPQRQMGGSIRVNPPNSVGGFGRGRRFNSPAWALPYWYNYDSFDRGAILGRLEELEAARVGLQARWRILEDEARRAGAQPGWLRQ